MKCICGYMDKESVEKELNPCGAIGYNWDKCNTEYQCGLRTAEYYGEFTNPVLIHERLVKPDTIEYGEFLIKNMWKCPVCDTVKMEV